MTFRTPQAEATFNRKYRHEGAETWPTLAKTLVQDVCGDYLTKSEREALVVAIETMKFIPGGRYLYYAGRAAKYFNNCYLLKAEEDTRQDWANLSWKSESALMTGGGIGVDYTAYRCAGSPLGRTGGVASGPIPKMQMIDDIGQHVMQGGSRRSAIYASLAHNHGDALAFLAAKDWHNMIVAGAHNAPEVGEVLRQLSVWDLVQADFNYRAPLRNTNISVNYDTAWHREFLATGDVGEVFRRNVAQALRTAEPGLSFNMYEHEGETLRNACCEITSFDDSDVCNIGSLNLSRIESLKEFRELTHLATLFLLCGSFRAHVPYEKVRLVREKNRRLGLGLMGVHEWLMKRGERYEVTSELHQWLDDWRAESATTAFNGAQRFSCSVPVATRAIAPTGTIGMVAGTTTGIEPLFAVAYKRRHLENGTEWKENYVIDGAAQELIDLYGINPDKIESSADLAADPERRIKFQADVQDYVDQAISSTINLPAWGSPLNNEDTVAPFTALLAKYAHRLRGFTCYPDASRGGQPLTVVPYREAAKALGVSVQNHDICEIGGRGGSCGA